MHDITYLDNSEALEKAAHEWKNTKELGVDLECENNLRYYGSFISLIQLSSKEKNWIVDVLRIKEPKALIEVLEDTQIQKIFHDLSFDLRILRDELNCRPKNVYDTQLAAVFLGRKDLGLDHLLRDDLNVLNEHNFQMADWTKRPLPQDMLEYAACDTVNLIELRDVLNQKLREAGRLEWVMEELCEQEKKDWVFEKKTFMDFVGAGHMTDSERSILKAIFDLREELAQETNRPPYYIMRNKMIAELVKSPPRSPEDWRKLPSVHPIVKRKAEEFHNLVTEAKKKRIPARKTERTYLTPKQADILRILGELRDAESVKLGLTKHLILSKDQMQDIAEHRNLNSLRPWQKKLYSHRIQPHL
jgi:ribonuclease D